VFIMTITAPAVHPYCSACRSIQPSTLYGMVMWASALQLS